MDGTFESKSASNRLLQHVSAFGDGRPSAYERLERALGGELARMLVLALARRRQSARAA